MARDIGLSRHSVQRWRWVGVTALRWASDFPFLCLLLTALGTGVSRVLTDLGTRLPCGGQRGYLASVALKTEGKQRESAFVKVKEGLLL